MSTQSELEQQIKETKKAEVAFRWMSQKLSGPSKYVACDANAALLASYIDQHFGGEWSMANLDKSFEALESQLVHSHEPTLEPTITAQASQPAQAAFTQPADGLPPVPPGHNWPQSKAEIKSMRPDEYRNQYHHKRTGQQFRDYINAVLQRGI